jgi:hypothetical protein
VHNIIISAFKIEVEIATNVTDYCSLCACPNRIKVLASRMEGSCKKGNKTDCLIMTSYHCFTVINKINIKFYQHPSAKVNFTWKKLLGLSVQI